MGIITKGMGAVLKHIKKSGRVVQDEVLLGGLKKFGGAGDKWFKKTKKLQRSKKKSERIRGSMRIITPMTGAGTVGAISGAREGTKERKKRGVYGVERKRIRPKSIKNLPHDVKEQFKMIKEKFKKK